MKLLTLLFLFFTTIAYGQTYHFTPAKAIPDASFRGLSVVNDHVAWASGSKGRVGRSTDGGKSWIFAQVPGYEQCDFRSVYALDARTAIIANAGVPACVLRTSDGGAHWQEVYRVADTAAFIDGIAFRNEREGILYGDPLKGRLMILLTHDGGLTWQPLPEADRPEMADGEASFAASGTNIRYLKDGRVMIGTGGKVSGLLVSADEGRHWGRIATPILQGISSTGIFSFSFADPMNGIIVGGDYKRDSLTTDHVFYTKDGGKHWLAPHTATRGYRECVEYIDRETVIALGPGGADISRDGGINWMPLSDTKGYHVIRKGRKGKRILAAGSGKVAIVSQR